jgi:hypothetical protein
MTHGIFGGAVMFESAIVYEMVDKFRKSVLIFMPAKVELPKLDLPFSI